MKTIIMDSANKYLVVALYEDEKCLASLQEEGNRKQSEYAIVYLQKLLQENHLKMSDFDEMVITIGPGSYTGVRVALTIAKTLNATMNIKVKTVSSLKAMAGMKKAISILDARSHKLFLGIYNEGKVIVDDGACEALKTHTSLLPKGIKEVEGSFMQGSVIDVLSFKGQLIARGITNYSSDELKLIKDHHSNEIESILHYKDYDEVIHADNLVINKG